MNGEQLYKIHAEACKSFNVGVALTDWSQMTSSSKAFWEELAYEQELRDRPESAKVKGERSVSYDGPYSD